MALSFRDFVSLGEPRSKYMPLEELGRGGFGAVYKALDTSTGQQVAIKKMTLQEEMSEELVVNEILVMRDNRNPNIVTYLDSYLVDAEVWLAMEFIDSGTLFDVLGAVYLEEGQIGVVCREVRDPACASPGLHRMLLVNWWVRRAEISCSLLWFGASVMTPEGETASEVSYLPLSLHFLGSVPALLYASVYKRHSQHGLWECFG
ncbi:serine/threonine-protein kinase PAK 1-like [Prinia subflava]|uniref:serine/threonine-protein kinase PAK 1-like n=1 Tax=Prinia subflava TaxID=208062 RepID=UPI002FE24031